MHGLRDARDVGFAGRLVSEHSQDTSIALLTRDIAVLKDELEDHRRQIEAMKAERDKALKWGIVTLGGMVVSLLTWIVNIAKDHIK